MRFACGDMRDHIVSYQNDHRPSYWRRRALRQQARLRIDFSEILRVVRFSTFATISARTGHAAISGLSPLSVEERKSNFGAVRSVDDPGCVKTCRSQECAELFSLSSSLSSGRKHFWFSNLRNRDGISTRRLNVGVFTRPRPRPDIQRDLVIVGRSNGRLDAAYVAAGSQS